MAEKAEEKVYNPILRFQDIKLGEKLHLKLDNYKSVRSGEGKFGMWYLWFGEVTNGRVRMDKNSEPKEAYTGKVTMFLKQNAADELERLANGNVGLEVEIEACSKEYKGRLIKVFNYIKVKDGKPNKFSVTTSEQSLIDEVSDFISEGNDITEELFIKASQDPQYGNITEERAKDIYVKYFSK